MKKTTLFSLLTMMLLFVGNNVWADSEPFYTLWTISQTGEGDQCQESDLVAADLDDQKLQDPDEQAESSAVGDRSSILPLCQ